MCAARAAAAWIVCCPPGAALTPGCCCAALQAALQRRARPPGGRWWRQLWRRPAAGQVRVGVGHALAHSTNDCSGPGRDARRRQAGGECAPRWSAVGLSQGPWRLTLLTPPAGCARSIHPSGLSRTAEAAAAWRAAAAGAGATQAMPPRRQCRVASGGTTCLMRRRRRLQLLMVARRKWRSDRDVTRTRHARVSCVTVTRCKLRRGRPPPDTR